MAKSVMTLDMDTEEDDEQTIDFVTLGMFIIDEIEYPPPRPPARDVLGGAGSFSALGARLLSPPPLSRRVAWIVDQGSDFPAPVARVIDSWATSCVFRPTPDRPTTRGWNGYADASCSRRAFRYVTPKRQLTAADLDEEAAPVSWGGGKRQKLLHARAVHMICSPQRCRDLVTDLLARRRAAGLGRPLIVWEPVPDSCVPDELLNCTNALPLVDVCSPNHAELARLVGSDGPGADPDPRAAIEANCELLLASMPLQSYALVVRAGELGCYVARNGGRKRGQKKAANLKTTMQKRGLLEDHDHDRGGLRPDTDFEVLLAGLLPDRDGVVARDDVDFDPGVETWLPAYHDGHDAAVVDPTGGGNAFLGGLAVALARGKSVEEACEWGSVAASFAIEQLGVPTLGCDDDGNETWNGVRVEHRLREYVDRLR